MERSNFKRLGHVQGNQGSKSLKQRQKDFDASIMRENMKKIISAEKRSNVSFHNESFDLQSLKAMFKQIAFDLPGQNSSPDTMQSRQSIQQKSSMISSLLAQNEQMRSPDERNSSNDIHQDMGRQRTSVGLKNMNTYTEIPQNMEELQAKLQMTRQRKSQAEDVYQMNSTDFAQGLQVGKAQSYQQPSSLQQEESPSQLSSSKNASDFHTSSTQQQKVNRYSQNFTNQKRISGSLKLLGNNSQTVLEIMEEQNEEDGSETSSLETELELSIASQEKVNSLSTIITTEVNSDGGEVPLQELLGTQSTRQKAKKVGLKVKFEDENNEQSQQKKDSDRQVLVSSSDDDCQSPATRRLQKQKKQQEQYSKESAEFERDFGVPPIAAQMGQGVQDAKSQLRNAMLKRKQFQNVGNTVGNETMDMIESSDILIRAYQSNVGAKKEDQAHLHDFVVGTPKSLKTEAKNLAGQKRKTEINVNREEVKKLNSQMSHEQIEEAYVPEESDPIDNGSRGSGFEETLGVAMLDEQKAARNDNFLISEKTKIAFIKNQRAKRLQEESNQRKTMNPQIRRAITILRKQMTKDSEAFVSTNHNAFMSFTDQAAAADKVPELSKIDSELARLIEQTYQYIYSVEEKRMARMIHKVEDLFESNPLMFDDIQVSTQLMRLKKMKQSANLLQSHVLIFEQAMEEQKRKRETMKKLIAKHQIEIKTEVKTEMGEQHIRLCNDDYGAFHTFKANKFFSENSTKEKQPKMASQMIKKIIAKVTMQEELFLLGKFIVNYLPPKMQRVFLQKCNHILRVDYEDPAIYIKVDENQYVPKPDAGSKLASPRSHESSPVKSLNNTDKSPNCHNPSSPNSHQNKKSQSFTRQAQQSSTKTAAVEVPKPKKTVAKPIQTDFQRHQPKMVTAYNMQYILAKINNKWDKAKVEGHLERYIQAQLRTMPRVVDEDQNIKERFANLQKLLSLLNDLSNQVAWVTVPLDKQKKQQQSANKPTLNEMSPISVIPTNLPSHTQLVGPGTMEKSPKRIQSQKKNELSSPPKFKRLQLSQIEKLDKRADEHINFMRESAGNDSFFGTNSKANKVTFRNSQRSMNSSVNTSHRRGEDSIYSQTQESQRNFKIDQHVNSIMNSALSKRDESITSQTDSANGDQKNRKSPVIQQIISKIVKAQIKKVVPRQVYIDCADEINKALFHDNTALKNHKKRFSEMKARRINNNNTNSDLFNLEVDTQLLTNNNNSTAIGSDLNHLTPSLSLLHNSSRNQSMMSRTPFSQSIIQTYLRFGGGALTPLVGNKTQQRSSSQMRGGRDPASQSHSTFLPLLNRSRVDRSVQHRSHQMLDKMKNKNILADMSSTGEQFPSRPKFRKTVAEFCDFTKAIPKQMSALEEQFLKAQQDMRTTQQSKSSRVSSQDSMGITNEFHQDREQLRNVIRMCMSTDYTKAEDQEQARKVSRNIRRNKATFASGSKSGQLDETVNNMASDQVGLAFRKSALSALQVDEKMFKKMEMSRYIEDVRMIANAEIQDFFAAIDPNTAPKNLKLLYFYFVGSRNLNREMIEESVATYQSDQMQPVRRDLRKAITGKCTKPGKTVDRHS